MKRQLLRIITTALIACGAILAADKTWTGQITAGMCKTGMELGLRVRVNPNSNSSSGMPPISAPHRAHLQPGGIERAASVWSLSPSPRPVEEIVDGRERESRVRPIEEALGKANQKA